MIYVAQYWHTCRSESNRPRKPCFCSGLGVVASSTELAELLTLPPGGGEMTPAPLSLGLAPLAADVEVLETVPL